MVREWIVRSLPQTGRAIHKRMDRTRRATGAELEETGLRIYAEALNRIPISAGPPKGSGYIRSEPDIVQIGFDAFEAPNGVYQHEGRRADGLPGERRRGRGLRLGRRGAPHPTAGAVVGGTG